MNGRVADSLREGKAPEIIRRKGAEGNLPVSLEEKIEILVILAGDQDESLRDTALHTLETWNEEELRQVLSNPAVPVAVVDFAASHLAPKRQAIAAALLDNSALSPDLRELVQHSSSLPAEESVEEPAPQAAEPPTESAAKPDKERVTLLQRIGRMSAAEKIKAALTGNQEERLVLIRDSNKVVSRAVLQSPKVSDLEVESFASMKNVSEEVLRLIAMSRKFMKSYSVARALANNPRAPIDTTLPLLNRLNERDLKGLMLNKNVPEVLRGMAAKMVKQKQEAQKPKLPGKH